MYIHIQNPPPGLIANIVRPEQFGQAGMGKVKTAEFAATNCAQVETADEVTTAIVRAFAKTHELEYSEHQGTLKDAAQLPGGSASRCPHH
jgi:hypothetical protein